MEKLNNEWEDCIDLLVSEYGWDENTTRDLAFIYSIDDNFGGFRETVVKIFELSIQRIKAEDAMKAIKKFKSSAMSAIDSGYDPKTECTHNHGWCNIYNKQCPHKGYGTEQFCDSFKSIESEL